MTIPFSSPAGVVLTKKSLVNEDYKTISNDEINEDCPAKPTIRFLRNKQRLVTGPDTAVLREMRKRRNFYWPKKTFHSYSRDVNFEFLNRSLIQSIPSCTVVMEKLSDYEIMIEKEKLARMQTEKKRLMDGDCVDLCSDSEGDSVKLDEDVRCQENFYGIPSSSLGFRNPPLQQITPTLPVMFYNRSQSSHQITTSSIGFYPQYSITTESTTTNIINRIEHTSDASSTKRSIQQWIKSVNGESNCYTSQQSIANKNQDPVFFMQLRTTNVFYFLKSI